MKRVLPEKQYLTIVNGSENFYPLNVKLDNQVCPHVTAENDCFINKRKTKKKLKKKKQIKKKSLNQTKRKEKEFTFSKTMWQFWWPYTSYDEAKQNNFENMIFNKYKISFFKRFIQKKRNNLRITKLLKLIGKMCTYSAYTKAGVEHNLELCNLHYIRKFKLKLNKKLKVHEQRDCDFFGLFNDPAYYESNHKMNSLTEMEKVHFLREKDEKNKKKEKSRNKIYKKIKIIP